MSRVRARLPDLSDIVQSDDILCIVNTAEEAKTVIKVINEELAKFEMCIEASKTEIIRVGLCDHLLDIVELGNNVRIKCSKQMKYLGYFIEDQSMGLNTKYHLDARLKYIGKYVEDKTLAWICSNYRYNFKVRRC